MPQALAVGLSVLKWVAIVLVTLIVVIALGFAIVSPATRSFTNRWGATDAETTMPFPGDEFVAHPAQVSTKAVTIAAPPELVYKLLVQMGYKRGGWYGWDWFYNATGSGDFVGGHYATTIVPSLQTLREGDTIRINKMVGYQVAELDQPSSAKPGWMLLEAAFTPDGKPASIVHPPANAIMQQSWVWFVYPAPNGGTRLVLRIRAGGASMGKFVDWLYANPLDFGGAVMGYKTLWGIKKTAENLAARGVK